MTRVSPPQSYRAATQNALGGDTCSAETQAVLRRYDLETQVRKDPAAALQFLHAKACAGDERNLLFALSELNYLQAERLARNPARARSEAASNQYLAAAIYGWLFLFGEGKDPRPEAFDSRFRIACELYNRGLGQGLVSPGSSTPEVLIGNARRDLPPGTVNVRLGQTALGERLDDFDAFLPADDFQVHGLVLRDRQSGIGAPLIGILKRSKGGRFKEHLAATAVLRVEGDVRAWGAGRLAASLELYAASDDVRVEVGGATVPLQTDQTVPPAHALSNAEVWALGPDQFFSAQEKIRSDVYLTRPYIPGRVPVLFVHGTFSSPAWWAEMWNTLFTDPVLRERCQFWYFIYNSGNQMSVSADRLRSAILRRIEQLDPEGKDPALRQMVVVGHSQGGLLAKLTATDTGTKLWRIVTDKELDSLDLDPGLKETLRRNSCYTPLPCVKRVVFIATPHRGSYLAGGFVRRLARRLMKLPSFLTGNPDDFRKIKEQLDLPRELRAEVPTSLDGMSPKNRFLLALADMPVGPGIKAHSIVAIKGRSVPPQGGDGVVKYRSAHIDYAVSECIVRGAHRCQNQPETIAEVRRILLEHLGEMAAGGRGQAGEDHQ